MHMVFQLSERPDLREAQRLSEALDRAAGVVSALVDPQLAKVFVTFDPDMTGDLTLQGIVEAMGYRIASEGEAASFETESPGYLREAMAETLMEDRAAELTRDAEFTLPDEGEAR
jgi:hypothetical protein